MSTWTICLPGNLVQGIVCSTACEKETKKFLWWVGEGFSFAYIQVLVSGFREEASCLESVTAWTREWQGLKGGILQLKFSLLYTWYKGDLRCSPYSFSWQLNMESEHMEGNNITWLSKGSLFLGSINRNTVLGTWEVILNTQERSGHSQPALWPAFYKGHMT